MGMTKSEVEQVAQLARLELSEQGRDVFTDQLRPILAFMDQLRAVKTEQVPQTASVSDQTNVLRSDEPRPSLSQDQALANAPESEDGFFVVPKIIHERS